MSVSIRINQINTESYALKGAEEEKDTAKGHKSFDGSALKMSGDVHSQVEAKRESARKRAMKLIRDAWSNDRKLSQGMEEMNNEKADRVSGRRSLKEQVDEMTQIRDGLKEKYGVASDSQEQKDLELLTKYQNNKSGVSFDAFSEDEIARLGKLEDIPLTDYQKDYLSLNGAKNDLTKELKLNDANLIALTQSIEDTTSQMLKSQDMLKAEKAADKLMEAAGDEIMGMLVKEGTDKIEEDQKEEEEKAEKAEEAKEEREERIEEAKEERREEKELIESEAELQKMESDASVRKQSVDRISEVQKNIKKILTDGNLVDEDLKGIEIDLNF